MPSNPPASSGLRVALLGAAWLLFYFGVRLALEAGPGLPAGARLGLAFLPTPIFAALLWHFVRNLQGADELERRIQLESLAVAFPLGLLLLTTLGLVQRAVALSLEDWSYNHIWPFFVIFYLLGQSLARRRYA